MKKKVLECSTQSPSPTWVWEQLGTPLINWSVDLYMQEKTPIESLLTSGLVYRHFLKAKNQLTHDRQYNKHTIDHTITRIEGILLKNKCYNCFNHSKEWRHQKRCKKRSSLLGNTQSYICYKFTFALIVSSLSLMIIVDYVEEQSAARPS